MSSGSAKHPLIPIGITISFDWTQLTRIEFGEFRMRSIKDNVNGIEPDPSIFPVLKNEKRDDEQQTRPVNYHPPVSEQRIVQFQEQVRDDPPAPPSTCDVSQTKSNLAVHDTDDAKSAPDLLINYDKTATKLHPGDITRVLSPLPKRPPKPNPNIQYNATRSTSSQSLIDWGASGGVAGSNV